MGEFIRYKGSEVKIGTCENMYYTSYQKYKKAFDLGHLQQLPGNADPSEYLDTERGYRFRFPFPDEDKLPPGEIIGPHDRGVKVTLADDWTTDGTSRNMHIEILQQKPIYRRFDDKFCLALVIREPPSNEVFRIVEDEHVRTIVGQLVKNNIVNETDPKKKSFYRSVAIRVLKGCSLNVLSEYKSAVIKVNTDPFHGQYQVKNKQRGLRKRI